MIVPRRRKDGSVAYQVRVSVGGEWLPAETFDRLNGPGGAKARERELLEQHAYRRYTRETCDSFALRWPDDYRVVKTGPTRGRAKSAETLDGYRSALRPFMAEFAGVPLVELATDRPRARSFAATNARAAVVVRNMLQDAVDDGIVPANSFLALQIEKRSGRKHHAPLTVEDAQNLAEVARAVHGPDWGPVLAAMIEFSFYVGPRVEEGCWLEAAWIHLSVSEVYIGKAKFGKQRTVLLLDEAARAYRDMPKRLDLDHGGAFWSKTGRRMTAANLWPQWVQVREVWWSQLTAERHRELVDVDWHSLRHGCGHHFYVTLGFTDEEAAHQLGHADAKLIRDLYGHGRHAALDRMKQRMLQTGRPGATTLQVAAG